MRFQNTILYAVLIFSAFLIGCAPTETTNTNTTNTKTINANIAATTAENPLETTKAPETAISNNAPTLAPVVQNYYAALAQKDEAGAKKSLSQAAQKYWENEAKTEKESLIKYLTETEEPLDAKRDVRNEKIEGDTATAEIRGGSLANWTVFKFVRENGEWKYASPKDSFSLQNIPKSATGTSK